MSSEQKTQETKGMKEDIMASRKQDKTRLRDGLS